METIKFNKRQRRIFSVELRKQVVKDIEKGKCTVLRASEEFGVSTRAVYNWLNQYSRYLQKSIVMVVENQSESYQSKELQTRIKELEAALGRKQMEIDLLNKIIDLANDEYHTDIKKNSSKDHLSGSASTNESDTSIK